MKEERNNNKLKQFNEINSDIIQMKLTKKFSFYKRTFYMKHNNNKQTNKFKIKKKMNICLLM